jgi:hypothetical protein
VRLCIAAALILGAAPAAAHDQLANGKPVPGWIKSACCGTADAHHLRPDQVTLNNRGEYVVEGYRESLASRFALPSQDGQYWTFYIAIISTTRSRPPSVSSSQWIFRERKS